MNYVIEHHSKIPAYLQLYHYFIRDIASGLYPFGTKLPSKRIIAEETGVSVITVEHALNLLCDEGYLEARQRSGYFVIYRETDFQVVPQTKQPEWKNIHPQIHTVSEFPFSVLAKTMRRVLLNYGEDILVRSPNRGCEELRTEICAYLGRSRGIQVHPDQVVIGSGAEYLYGMIAQLFGTGCVFALENPSYEKIRKVYETMGITCEMLTLSADGILSGELAGTRATVLHVTPFHSYPSGITIGISKKKEYLRWAKIKNAVIIEDNYDSELTVSSKPETSLFSMAKEENVIYMNTFTKTIAPSVRIGYMILPLGMVSMFHDRLGFYSCTVPLFEQYVLAELLRSGDYERHLNRVRRKRRTKALH